MKIGNRTKATKELTRQERNRRNNMKRITISALVAFILFVALTIIQSSILNQESKITVYQVSKDIVTGTKFTKDNFSKYFSKKDIQESLIPKHFVVDEKEIIGKFAARDYSAKDIVTTDGLKDSERKYNANIKNPTKVSFSVGSVSDSVSGTIREGDYINIYGMTSGFNGEGQAAKINNKNYTFKHVYIDKAYDGSGVEIETSDKETEAALFTIVIEENDVDIFNEMIANSDLKLAKLMYTPDQDYKAFVNDGAVSDSTTVEPVQDDNTARADQGQTNGNNESDPIKDAVDTVNSNKDSDNNDNNEAE